MLLKHVTGPATNPFAALTQRLCSSYAIDDQHEVSRSNCVRRTRSQTAILAGNTLLHPDYRAAACSGFAASATLAPPPKSLFCSSPPPRSTRLGTTIPLGRPVSRHLTPTANPQMDHSPPAASAILLYNTTNNDNSAAAEPLSNTLLGYSHRDPDRAQRAGPLCDATQRYIQLDCPNPPILVLCGGLSSHTRSEIANIANLTAKGRLLQGIDDTFLLVRKSITATSAPDGHNSRRSRLAFDDLVRIYVPLLARPGIMHGCHADASCHLGVTGTLKMLERLYW